MLKNDVDKKKKKLMSQFDRNSNENINKILMLINIFEKKY